MSELKAVGRIVAAIAEEVVPVLIRDDNVPSINTRIEALDAIERVVTQDAVVTSKRVWATVMAVLTAVLAVPEVQSYLGPWAPIVTAALSAALAGWSKAEDPRPVR